MKNWLKETGLMVCELEDFQNRAMEQLNWSYQAWQRRFNGTTELSEAERIALTTILKEMRNGSRVIFVSGETEYKAPKI